MSQCVDSDSDGQDWFDKDEDEILQSLRAKASNSNSPTLEERPAPEEEHISGPAATDEFLMRKNLAACAAAAPSKKAPSKLSTADLRKIALMEPLDAFLRAATFDSDFFVDQLAESDSQERVLLYAQILVSIAELQLPGFQTELLQKFIGDEVLLEHYRVIATKLFSKRYKTLWTDGERVDELVHTIQTLLVHAHQMGLLTPKARDVMRNIMNLIQTSDAQQVVERESCQAFYAQLKRMLTETPLSAPVNEKIEIFPTLDELLERSANVGMEAESEEGVEEAKGMDWSKSSYTSVSDYIDRQKQMLREDFVIALRESVCALRENEPSGVLTQHKNVRIVLNADFLSASRHEMLFVDLLGDRRSDHKQKLSVSIRNKVTSIKTGTLLCFTTSTDFENLILATVTHTDAELLSKGYIGIEIARQYNIGSIYLKDLLMFEAPAFLEPYRNVYNYLNNCVATDLPMQRYIVEGQTDVRSPSYLTEKTRYTYEHESFTPLNQSSSPKKLPLNKSQLSAYRDALSKEFCLIQGPPGTGKTHLSVHLVRTLLANANTPIVLITYTNESLDKFLLKLAPYTHNIIRFGSQSRQPKIEKFNMHASLTDKSLVNPLLKRLYYLTSQELKTKFEMLQTIHAEFDGSEESYQRILAAQRVVRAIAEKLNCIRVMFQYYVVRKTAVIALTTTCAAKTNFLFRLLKSRVVIFEEAAEILESHVLACLTPYTQHVIMIGDHLQLQPYTSSYQHSRSCHLNVSLFERLIRQNIQRSVLSIQYRMRPSIAALICPVIYEELKNDDIVETFLPVREMRSNVYFCTHEQSESLSESTSSAHNQFEAVQIAKLAEYLIVMANYAAEDIVILSPYARQTICIKNELTKYELEHVQVATVDSFQGMEANIVLVSLVRSNVAGQIGFLREKPRICVTLSRAKHGLYMIGNMKLLAKCSGVWRAVKQQLEVQKAIGTEFPFETHSNDPAACLSLR